MFELVLLIFVVTASRFTVSMIKQRRQADKLFLNGVKTQGVVTGFKTHVDNTGILSEYPIIKFTTSSGIVVELEAKSQIPALNKGERVTIFHDSFNPQNFVQDSETLSILPYLLVGLMWSGVGVAVVIYLFFKH